MEFAEGEGGVGLFQMFINPLQVRSIERVQSLLRGNEGDNLLDPAGGRRGGPRCDLRRGRNWCRLVCDTVKGGTKGLSRLLVVGEVSAQPLLNLLDGLAE
jgi:hypothetical protein